MNIDELSKIIPYCISCGRHCPIESLHCTKGQEFILGLLYTMNVYESGKKTMNSNSEFSILHFSGTGNSSYVANKAASATGGNLISINDMLKSGISGAIDTGENLVICAPVYAWRIPRVVEAWLKDASFPKAKRAWFLLTCGSEIGNAGKYCRKLCQQTGLEYMGTGGFVMPCNHITLFEVPDENEVKQIISHADPLIEQSVKTIALGEALCESTPGFSDKLKSDMVTPLFYPMFIKTKPFYVTDSCIGCGKCALMCPLNNISIVGGKPVWGDNCTHCLSCICRCPQSAVEYGSKSQGKPRFHLD